MSGGADYSLTDAKNDEKYVHGMSATCLELFDLKSYHYGSDEKGIRRLVGGIPKVTCNQCDLGYLCSSQRYLLNSEFLKEKRVL